MSNNLDGVMGLEKYTTWMSLRAMRLMRSSLMMKNFRKISFIYVVM